MIHINIYAIGKGDADYENIQKALLMRSLGFNVKINIMNIFSQHITKAQKISASKAQESYTKAFMPFLKDSQHNIALDIKGKKHDSASFATFLESIMQRDSVVQFFIGGAFGLEKAFLQQCENLSLSHLTLNHKIAKLMLCEQIYRALCILNAHPYHK